MGLKEVVFLIITITAFLACWVDLKEGEIVGVFDAYHFFFLLNHYAEFPMHPYTWRINYPYGVNLWKITDSSPITGLIAFVVGKFAESPISIYNLTILLSPYITAIITYFIAKDYTKDEKASVIAALLFSLSYYGLYKMLVHANLMNIGLAIVPVYMFYKVMKEGGMRNALGFGIAFGLLPYLSLAYTLIFSAFFATYLFYKLIVEKGLGRTKELIAGGLVALPISFPLLKAGMGYPRVNVLSPPVDGYGFDLLGLVLPSYGFPTAFPLPKAPLLFSSFVVGIPLLLLGVVHWRKLKEVMPFLIIPLLLSFGYGVVLSGVKISENPLKVALLTYPFSLIRTPDRFILIGFFFLTLALSKVIARMGNATLFLFLLTQLLLTIPDFQKSPTEVIPEGKYYFFPFNPKLETERLFYSYTLITLSNSSMLNYEASRGSYAYYLLQDDLFWDMVEDREALVAYLRHRGIDKMAIVKEFSDVDERIFGYSLQHVEEEFREEFEVVYESGRVVVFDIGERVK